MWCMEPQIGRHQVCSKLNICGSPFMMRVRKTLDIKKLHLETFSYAVVKFQYKIGLSGIGDVISFCQSKLA